MVCWKIEFCVFIFEWPLGARVLFYHFDSFINKKEALFILYRTFLSYLLVTIFDLLNQNSQNGALLESCTL